MTSCLPTSIAASHDEAERLAALRALTAVGPADLQRLDALAGLASAICDAPIALVTLVEEHWQDHIARRGFHAPRIPREQAFCRFALTEPEQLLIVPDATQDSRFATNPLVTGDSHVRFYAGAPLVTPDRQVLGTLCVLDRRPRSLTDVQRSALKTLAEQVMTELQLSAARHEQAALTVRLAERNGMLLAAEEIASVGSWRVSLADGSLVWSEQARRIFGLQHADEPHVLADIERYLHPDDRTLLAGRLRHMSRAGEENRCEHRIVRPDGAVRLLEQRWRVTRATDDAPASAIGSCRDITEERAAEQRLLRLNRVHALLSRVNHTIVHETDRDALYQAACDIAVTTAGLRAAWVGIVDPETQDAIPIARAGSLDGYLDDIHISALPSPEGNGPFGRSIRGNVTTTCDDTLTDPSFMWKEPALSRGFRAVAAFPLRRADVPYGAFVLYADTPGFFDGEEVALLEEVTANIAFAVEALEQQARADQAQHERDRVFTLSPDLLSIGTIEGRLLQVNPAWERVLGWTREELLARPWLDFVHPDDREVTRDAVRRLIRGETLFEFENRYLHRDGSARWLSWSSHALLETRQIFSVARDVTDRRALEAQLLRAQRMESIGTLAGGIAHDLNNVLTPILSSIDMLRDGSVDAAERSPILDEVARSARRGADMVRQLLLFARGSAGERRPLPIARVVDDVLRTAAETFPRSIRISHESDAPNAWVEGDATQLQQVLLNLAVNARDAMPDGGALRVRVTTRTIDTAFVALNPDATPGEFVVLEVADTGIGMSPTVLAQIFDPFFTTKPQGVGTGLGLSTSRSIVLSHRGFLRVESAPGTGTTFSVHLPTVPSQASRVPTPSHGLPRGRGERILLVDDEAAIRAVASRVLRTFGYDVMTASDGASAEATLAASPASIDLMITDLMMPVMDGVQLIRAARRLRPTLPIIATTGLHDDARRHTVRAEGVEEFLAKPYAAAAILSAVRRALDHAGVR